MTQDFYDNSGKIWTPSDANQITTPDQFKFGTQSFRPYNLGYISTPAHADFATGAGNFTYEFWIKWTATGNWFYVYWEDSSGALFELYIGINGKIECTGWDGDFNNYFSIYADPWVAFSTNTWYHIAIERVGDDGYIFRDGVPQGTDNYFEAGASVNLYDSAIQLGLQSYDNLFVDEFRLSNTNRYPAGGFTPAIAQFTLDANTKVLLHFEPYEEPPQPTTLGQVILWKRKGV